MDGGLFDLRVIMEQWAQIGMFDVMLPLLLVFVVIYAILNQSKILGQSRALNSVVACIIAFFVIANKYVTELFIPIFSQAGLAIIILLAVMLIIGLFFTKAETPKWIKTCLALLGIGLFLWLLSRMAEKLGIWSLPIQTFFFSNSYWIIPFILIIAAIIGVMLDKPSSTTPAHPAPVSPAPQG